MKDNRKIWLNPFGKENFPNWNCPHCNDGILRPVDKSFHFWESADSHELGRKYLLENRQSFDDSMILGMQLSEYRYSVFLKCNRCDECVSSCGSGNVIEDYIPEISDTVLLDRFFPHYFYPALNIFSVSEKCPEMVSNQIKSSFKLFFTDPSASANYIRKAVDEILTSRRVKRFVLNKNKRRFSISLHDRIVEFEKSNPKIAKKLFAIKILGNEGSHTNKMTKNDVLDAYEILEEVIDDLYVGYRRLIEKKVSKINKGKRPLHPST